MRLRKWRLTSMRWQLRMGGQRQLRSWWLRLRHCGCARGGCSRGSCPRSGCPRAAVPVLAVPGKGTGSTGGQLRGTHAGLAGTTGAVPSSGGGDPKAGASHTADGDTLRSGLPSERGAGGACEPAGVASTRGCVGGCTARRGRADATGADAFLPEYAFQRLSLSSLCAWSRASSSSSVGGGGTGPGILICPTTSGSGCCVAAATQLG
jgi:hypothetical protein